MSHARSEEEDEEEEDQSGSYDGADGLLGASAFLSGDALARSLAEVQTNNELGLLRSEVGRMRSKIQMLEREKDDMVDNFGSVTKILLNRIKELEGDLTESNGRPQTAAVIDRIEGRSQARAGGSRSAPEVMRIDEEQPGAEGKEVLEDPEETQACGNCAREIPAGNLVSHSVFCYRNNYRCSACDEVIALRDKDSHMLHWTDPLRLLDATRDRDSAAVQAMAAHGVDFGVAVHPQTKDTVLHAAARIGDVELVSFFMGYGVDVDPVNEQGDTPLHVAAEAAELPTLKLLVELGANVNLSNGRGESPLILVCRRGAAQAASFLLDMRADAEACTKLGDTPLQIAQRLGFQDTVLALCTAGAQLRPGTPSRARSGSPMPLQGGGGGPACPSPPGSAGSGSRASLGKEAGYPPLPPRPGRPPAPNAPSGRASAGFGRGSGSG
ncbi:unnamed protein product [Polarella glacialis]|uniref:Uncharacterized protein n=1 Tax=Polarella glacialis TaxID=89957 RepID=A0A813IYD9_POLGL|nr:unnamed protein product [Polarella glacialis]